jgi:hypothetical protein
MPSPELPASPATPSLDAVARYLPDPVQAARLDEWLWEPLSR